MKYIYPLLLLSYYSIFPTNKDCVVMNNPEKERSSRVVKLPFEPLIKKNNKKQSHPQYGMISLAG